MRRFAQLGRSPAIRNNIEVEEARRQKRLSKLNERIAEQDERQGKRLQRNAERRNEILAQREDRQLENNVKYDAEYQKMDKRLRTQTEKASLRERKRISKEVAREQLRAAQRKYEIQMKAAALKEKKDASKWGHRSIEMMFLKFRQQLERQLKPYFKKKGGNDVVEKALDEALKNINNELETALYKIQEETRREITSNYQQVKPIIDDVMIHSIEVFGLDQDQCDKIFIETMVEYTRGRITDRGIVSYVLKRADTESRLNVQA